MILKNTIRIILSLVLLGLFSCEKDEDYITVDDLMVQEGNIIGSIKGLSADSISVDETIDLNYSYKGNNNISFEDDQSMEININYMSEPYTNNDYSCNTTITISVEEGVASIENCTSSLTKVLNDHQIISLYLGGSDDLTLSDFSYDSIAHKVSGKISGELELSSFYSSSYNGDQEPFDIDLEFNSTVWEILK